MVKDYPPLNEFPCMSLILAYEDKSNPLQNLTKKGTCRKLNHVGVSHYCHLEQKNISHPCSHISIKAEVGEVNKRHLHPLIQIQKLYAERCTIWKFQKMTMQ